MSISIEEITRRVTLNTNDVLKVKGIVIMAGLGIATLSDDELLEKLEEIYWQGYKGCLDKLGIDFEKQSESAKRDTPNDDWRTISLDLAKV